MKNRKSKIYSIRAIPLEKLIEHPMNANRMSGATFRKLIRNIERTNFYEPLVVRRLPERKDFYQIINGHQRARALGQLGYERADCIIKDFDDEEAKLLIVTLNRLTGRDLLEKKRELIGELNESFGAGELAKVTAFTKGQIEKLCSLTMPKEPVKIEAKAFAKPVVFFVSDEQSKTIEQALSAAEEKTGGDNRAVRRAQALTDITHQWFCRLCREAEE